MTRQQINIVIDELELTGVASDQSEGVSRALQQELGRLMTEQGVPAKLLSGQAHMVYPLEANPAGAATLQATPSSTPSSMGRAAARAMYKGFNQ